MRNAVLVVDVPAFGLRAGTKGRVITRYACGRAFICVGGRGGLFLANEFEESKDAMNVKEKNPVIQGLEEAESQEGKAADVEEQVRQASTKAVRQWW